MPRRGALPPAQWPSLARARWASAAMAHPSWRRPRPSWRPSPPSSAARRSPAPWWLRAGGSWQTKECASKLADRGGFAPPFCCSEGSAGTAPRWHPIKLIRIEIFRGQSSRADLSFPAFHVAVITQTHTHCLPSCACPKLPASPACLGAAWRRTPGLLGPPAFSARAPPPHRPQRFCATPTIASSRGGRGRGRRRRRRAATAAAAAAGVERPRGGAAAAAAHHPRRHTKPARSAAAPAEVVAVAEMATNRHRTNSKQGKVACQSQPDRSATQQAARQGPQNRREARN